MEENFQWLGIRSENDELSDTTVESFGGCRKEKGYQRDMPEHAGSRRRRTLVRSFLQLLELRGTLDEV